MNIFMSNQDLFYNTIKKLYINPEFKCKPRNLFIHEDIGFSGRIINPFDRLIFMPDRHWDIVYGIGEFLWYVTGSNSLEFIQYYAPSYNRFSDDGKTLYGAYGNRLFEYDNSNELNKESSIRSVIRKLKEDPDSRQAIIVIGEQHDYNPQLVTKDRPCTMFVHFLIREKQLDCYVYMRSNDILWGAFNINVFEWTTLQMIVANVLKVDMGLYQHHATSMHLYTNKDKRAENILSTTHYNIYDTFTLTQPKDNIGIDEFEHEINTFMINSYEFISEDIKEGHYPFFNKIIFDEDSILTDYFKAVYSYIEIMKILNSNLSLPTKIYIIEATFNFALTYIYRIDILTAISELLFRKLREEISVYDEIAKLHNRLIDNIRNDIRLNDDTKSFITKGEL